MSEYDDIIRHESEADRLAAESDTHRWEAARLIAEKLDGGARTQRDVAAGIGKSRNHVVLMAAVWERFGHPGVQERSSFNECYQVVKRPARAEAEPQEIVAVTGSSEPTVRRDLAASFDAVAPAKPQVDATDNTIVVDPAVLREAIDTATCGPRVIRPEVDVRFNHLVDGLADLVNEGLTRDELLSIIESITATLNDLEKVYHDQYRSRSEAPVVA